MARVGGGADARISPLGVLLVLGLTYGFGRGVYIWLCPATFRHYGDGSLFRVPRGAQSLVGLWT